MNTINVFKSLAALSVAAMVTSLNANPIQWSASDGGNDHFYELIRISMSWSGAEAAAKASSFQGLQGHLATVTSAAENAFLDRTFLAYEYRGYWLGGFQLPNQTTPATGWQWVTGEAWDYTNWRSFEPNDWPGMWTEDNQENYLGFSHEGRGVWNDAANNEYYMSFGYFVEYEASAAIPDSGTTFVLLASLLALIGEARRRSTNV